MTDIGVDSRCKISSLPRPSKSVLDILVMLFAAKFRTLRLAIFLNREAGRSIILLCEKFSSSSLASPAKEEEMPKPLIKSSEIDSVFKFGLFRKTFVKNPRILAPSRLRCSSWAYRLNEDGLRIPFVFRYEQLPLSMVKSLTVLGILGSSGQIWHTAFVGPHEVHSWGPGQGIEGVVVKGIRVVRYDVVLMRVVRVVVGMVGVVVGVVGVVVVVVGVVVGMVVVEVVGVGVVVGVVVVVIGVVVGVVRVVGVVV
jgi:hypothetical protein